MKKIIISESMEKRLIQLMVEELAFHDNEKRLAVKDYLKQNFYPIKNKFTNGENGLPTPKEEYGVLYNGSPIQNVSYSRARVLEKLQYHFQNLFGADTAQRDEFLNSTLTAWFNNLINDNGNIV